MHTLETAVVLPLIFLILGGGLLLSTQTVGLIDRQVTTYAKTADLEAADCVQVLRIAEVTYDLLETFK